MDPNLFGEQSAGKLVSMGGMPGSNYAFAPDPLPPEWSVPNSMWPHVVRARAALASLDGIGRHLANPLLLLNPLQYREAQLSSELEGTFVRPGQLMLFEVDESSPDASDAQKDALREVRNLKRALDYYREHKEQLPISLRLIRDLHKVLMSGTGVRGAGKDPGNIRRMPVQIGRPARFVPPPAHYLPDLLSNLESYIHGPGVGDPLVDAYIAHYQFEAIHPFRDGNGRVGRLLLSIMIAEKCELQHNWLYMSAYFNARRDEYLDRLFRVSSEGDWAGWIQFCLEGTIEQAMDTIRRCDKLIELHEEFRERVRQAGGSYRLSDILENLFIVPVLTMAIARERLGVTYPTARADIEKLVRAGILEEFPDQRPRTFFVPRILDIIYERG